MFSSKIWIFSYVTISLSHLNILVSAWSILTWSPKCLLWLVLWLVMIQSPPVAFGCYIFKAPFWGGILISFTLFFSLLLKHFLKQIPTTAEFGLYLSVDTGEPAVLSLPKMREYPFPPRWPGLGLVSFNLEQDIPSPSFYYMPLTWRNWVSCPVSHSRCISSVSHDIVRLFKILTMASCPAFKACTPHHISQREPAGRHIAQMPQISLQLDST